MRWNSLVPTPRLLWLVALVVVPAATVAGAVPAWSGEAGLAILAAVLLASADAMIGWPRLAGVRLEVPAAVLHASKGREAEWLIRVRGLVTRTRAGVSFPDGVRCEAPVVVLTVGDEVARWRLTALRRGVHRIGGVHLEAGTPMGLWVRRRMVPAPVEVHVYPDMRRARAGLAAVFLNRGGAGRHARARVGKGREFEHLRDYASGDDFGDIHWKSTARRGAPVTKTFQIEQTREVYAVIDHSRLSAGTTRAPVVATGKEPAAVDEAAAGGTERVVTHLESALESALALGMAAERQRDLFGLVTFADRVSGFIRPGAGRGHYGVCRNAVFALEPRLVSPGFEELFVFLRRALTRRSLVVIFTDLSDPIQAEAFVRDVGLISRHHLVLVSMIRPEVAAPLFSAEAGGSVDRLYRSLAGHFLWHDLQEVAAVLARRGVGFSLPDSAGLTVDVVSRYMDVKNRQIL